MFGDTNYVDNPLQTKLQEILFELHDLKKLVSNTAKKTLQEQTDKLEEFEVLLFSDYGIHGISQGWHISNFKDGVSDGLVHGVKDARQLNNSYYKQGYDFGLTISKRQKERLEEV